MGDAAASLPEIHYQLIGIDATFIAEIGPRIGSRWLTDVFNLNDVGQATNTIGYDGIGQIYLPFGIVLLSYKALFWGE